MLFDVDLDEWSAQNAAHSQHMRYPSSGSTSSVSPPEMYRQPSQQSCPRSYPQAMPAPSHRGHALNLNFNYPQTASPASSLSSLSPGQMSLPPLTPGHEFGPGFGGDYGIVLNGADGLGLAINGPPTTPLSTSLTISPVIPGPSSYPGVPSSGGRGVNNSQVLLNQRRASLGLAQPSMSATSGPMATRQHPHPYAQGYQQRSANGRPSSLHLQHQMQQARRSPLHQEFQETGALRVGSANTGSIPEDGEYAAMYEKMYKERKRREMKQPGGRVQPTGSFPSNASLTGQRRHSAPLLEMQLQGDTFHNFSPAPVFIGEMGRRPSAPVVQMHQHQQQAFNNPNSGGYAPGLPPSPSSLSSSRSVPPAPSLSTSSSTSSNASRSPAAVASNQILSPQQSRHLYRHSALDTQHDNRLLSEMINSGSMPCIPGSVYDEDGVTVFSEGIPSMMQLEIDEIGRAHV